MVDAVAYAKGPASAYPTEAEGSSRPAAAWTQPYAWGER